MSPAHAVAALAVLSAALSGPSPDTLYAARADLASAEQAADEWAGELSEHPADFDAAWKLARACYWLGGHAPEPQRRDFLTRGVDAGRKAIAAAADRPEGHFWLAANMGALAEGSVRDGLKFRAEIKNELEIVRRVAPGFQEGSADRALGRWYFKVPALFGGSKTKAEAHLRASLEYNPHSTASHFFLAELFLDEKRVADSRSELKQVLDAPLDPEWTPEDRDFKAKAQALLARLAVKSP